MNLRLQAAADALLGACGLQSLQCLVTNRQQRLPVALHRGHIKTLRQLAGQILGSREERRSAHSRDVPGTVGRNPQTSSEVKLITGASNRTSASPSRHSAVCAERRASDFGADVYSRSFSTSK